MSIPYLVHKDDEHLFKKIEDLSKILDADFNKIIQPYLLREGLDINSSLKDLKYADSEGVALAIKFARSVVEIRAQIEEIQKIKDSIRTISMFDEQPKDLHNYWTYYRGHRWGEAAKDDGMLSTARNGIAKVKKALK